MSHHHNQPFLESLEADRRARGTRKRPPVDGAELDRLLRAASRGDGGAWSALVERFSARLRAVARRHRLGHHDAEDVVQTTWLRLLEHAGSVRDGAAVGAWLETTARRESLLVVGRRREHPVEAEQLAPEPVSAVDDLNLVAGERRAALGQALSELSPRQRRVLQLLFADDEPSYEQIADTLDIPIGSIGPTRARGLARLRNDPQLLAAVGDRV